MNSLSSACLRIFSLIHQHKNLYGQSKSTQIDESILIERGIDWQSDFHEAHSTSSIFDTKAKKGEFRPDYSFILIKQTLQNSYNLTFSYQSKTEITSSEQRRCFSISFHLCACNSPMSWWVESGVFQIKKLYEFSDIFRFLSAQIFLDS